MALITADDPTVKQTFQKILSTVIQHGGKVNKKLEFRYRDGDLSCHTTLPKSYTKRVIYVPDECLPNLDDFEVTLDGDQLLATPRRGFDNSLQIDLLNTIFDLYNQMGKIAQHREHCPWVALADQRELLDVFRNSRPNKEQYYGWLDDGNIDRVVLQSFFKSRVFRYTNARGQERNSILMPLIDTLNHHLKAPSIAASSAGDLTQNGIGITHARMSPTDSEIYYGYAFNDALHFFLTYSFVDTSAGLVKSIPLHIDIDGFLKLSIEALSVQQKAADVPEVAQGLHMHIPSCAFIEPGHMRVSHLFIPAKKEAGKLRRVLEVLSRDLLRQRGTQQQVESLVATIEKQVLDTNIAFYERVRSAADNEHTPPYLKVQIAELVDVQLKIIAAYKAAVSKLPLLGT